MKKSTLRHAERLAKLLDNQFQIGPFKFGLDPIVGLLPGLGDLLPALFSGYLVSIAIQERLPQSVIARMVFYAVADFAIGSVPILGDAADFFFKAYSKNLAILKQELKARDITSSQVQSTES